MHGIYKGSKVLIEHTNSNFHVIRFQDDSLWTVKIVEVEVVWYSVMYELQHRYLEHDMEAKAVRIDMAKYKALQAQIARLVRSSRMSKKAQLAISTKR